MAVVVIVIALVIGRGVPGVPVTAGGGEGKGVGERPGIVSTWPSASEFGSAMLFERTISSTVTPNRAAMPERVSPAFTR